MPRALLALATLAPLLPVALHAQPAQFLTDTSLRLTAARYAPVETDIHWDGWIGAGIGLARLRGITAYLEGDVETVLGSERRLFEATQSNYHLELGLRRDMPWGEASVFLHHVSRHAVDREKDPPIDWNVVMLGARGDFQLPGSGRIRSRWRAAAGRMLHVSNLGYRWEARAATEHDVLRRRWGAAFVGADLRAMKTIRTSLFPRTGFFDAKVEAGVRLVRERRSFEAFLAAERRNDVRLLSPEARRRIVVGVRLGLSAGSAPYDPDAPPSSTPWCSWR
jgi:hypothetical protein